MKRNVFILKEFLAKVKVSEQSLKQWEDLKLLKPAGFTDEKIPFYAEHSIKQVEHIQRLLDLGYGLEEIQQIIKKIGLPKSTAEKIIHSKSDQYLTVGGLAEKVGVSPRTIKHWENVGIIEPNMRSEGGFRLFSDIYIYLCILIKDLQLFGYTLDEIKIVSGYFKTFLNIQARFDTYDRTELSGKLDEMLVAIQKLYDKMTLLKGGIERWEDLLKKKKKEVQSLKNRNEKRNASKKESPS